MRRYMLQILTPNGWAVALTGTGRMVWLTAASQASAEKLARNNHLLLTWGNEWRVVEA